MKNLMVSSRPSQLPFMDSVGVKCNLDSLFLTVLYFYAISELNFPEGRLKRKLCRRRKVLNIQGRGRGSQRTSTLNFNDILLSAVLKQKYDVHVDDEYVISGNTAVLKCKIPSYVADYVIVTSWVQDDVINIYPNMDIGGKYVVLSSGDLYISNVGPGDTHKSYSCRTVHKLTGKYFRGISRPFHDFRSPQVSRI